MNGEKEEFALTEGFDIPVVLFLFQRQEAAVRILERIAQVRPQKLYILSDEGRDVAQKSRVAQCRSAVERAITWPCQVIRDYATQNRGVYGNIALGARRVLQQEQWAIFLEDDNLPEVTFFAYCRQMLIQYREDPRVLWVCGTNYFGNYQGSDGEDYKFTQHLLPCGWASWSHKFLKHYDGDLKLMDDPRILAELPDRFESGALYRMYRGLLRDEKRRLTQGKAPASWDYQMCLSLRARDMLGVVPMKNQIRNIGVDAFSAHGGSRPDAVMTRRLCGMDSYPLDFPLHGPKTVEKDPVFERRMARLLLPPLPLRLRAAMTAGVKKLLGLDAEISLRRWIMRK